MDPNNQVPDGDALGRFRNLLICNGIHKKLFTQVAELLEERGLLLKSGTIADSTLIAHPQAEKKRNPGAYSTKKGHT